MRLLGGVREPSGWITCRLCSLLPQHDCRMGLPEMIGNDMMMDYPDLFSNLIFKKTNLLSSNSYKQEC
jgi:hypothetical protein